MMMMTMMGLKMHQIIVHLKQTLAKKMEILMVLELSVTIVLMMSTLANMMMMEMVLGTHVMMT